MNDKKYYSQRYNIGTRDAYSLDNLITLFIQIYQEYRENGYFDELIGYKDSYGNWKNGKKGDDLDSFVFLRIGKQRLTPIGTDNFYREDDIFDLIELFYDHVSIPEEINRYSRSYDSEGGKRDFRTVINNVLENYKDGFELTEVGYIREKNLNGLENLVDQKQEHTSDGEPTVIIEEAKKKFFHYKSSESDKKSAILELGGVLEMYRRNIQKKFTSKDEDELFNVLNNFQLRHSNLKQKSDYDEEIFYKWIFFNQLSAIDAYFKMLNR
jgi:hypothetical protein